MKYHLIQPRGKLTTALRSLQDQTRRAQNYRARGTLMRRSPLGAAYRSRQRTVIDLTSEAETDIIPRWG